MVLLCVGEAPSIEVSGARDVAVFLVENPSAPEEDDGSGWAVSGREETLPSTIMGSGHWGGFAVKRSLAREAIGSGTRALFDTGASFSSPTIDGEVATVFNARDIWTTVAVGDETGTVLDTVKFFPAAVAAVVFKAGEI